MRGRRRKERVISLFGDMDSMSILEFESVIRQTFSEPDIMRRGVYYNDGIKAVGDAVGAYVRGDPITEEQRSYIFKCGLKRLRIELCGAKYLRYDRRLRSVFLVRG